MPEPLDLTLDDETAKLIADEVQRNIESGALKPQQGSELKLPGDDQQYQELIKKLEKYIDFDSGGLKLIDVPLRGNPAKFLLVPEISGKGVGISLRFEYRF